MKRTWKARMACCMPWRDFAAGETCDLEDGEVTDRVRALFDCMTPEEVRAAEEAARPDPDFEVKVQRLRQAKVTIPKRATKAEVEELFRRSLADGELPAPK